MADKGSDNVVWKLILVIIALGVLAYLSSFSHAAVPEACRAYQRQITSQAQQVFGLDAPIATLAAQVQQESSCNAAAHSPFAAGLTQFTPGTAADLAARYPDQLGAADPLNPKWAIAAQALYMRDLIAATPGSAQCSTWAFGLSAYNGGLGWLQRDQVVCRAQRRCTTFATVLGTSENVITIIADIVAAYGAISVPLSYAKPPATGGCGCQADTWFGNVEITPDTHRAPQFIAENRGYPKRILLTLTPIYVAGGYGLGVVCPAL